MKFTDGSEQKSMRDIAVCHIRYLFSPQGLKRLFTAWLIAATICIAYVKTPFTEKDFFLQINLPIFTLCVFIMWQSLCAIKNERPLNVLLIASAASLASLAAFEGNDFIFLIGLCGAVSLIVMFLDIRGLRLGRLSGPAFKWSVAAVLAVLLTLIVGTVGCMYYRNHWTSCYDFGIFSQVFYYLKETGLPLSTCERDGLLSHFAVHVSPVFYMLLPIYAVFPFPETLLIAQVAIIASGVIPLILICKRLGLANIEGLLFAICYLAYPAFTGGTNYYFHENCFLAPFIMWLLYFCETDNTPLILLFAAFTLSVKEDAAVYVAVIALYYILSAKSKNSILTNTFILLVSILYFVTATQMLAKYGDGAMTWRYSNYMYDGSQSLVTVFKAIAANPVYVVSQCFTQEKLIFMLQMLLPLGFLPLMAKSPKNLIMLIPFMLINLMTNYVYQYSINFQYTFGSGAALIFISAVNYSAIKKHTRAVTKVIVSAAACAVILFIGLHSTRLSYYSSYKQSADQRKTIDYALALVPDDASVCSSTFFVPNLSQRDEIYQLETTKHEAEYYVIDLRYTTTEFSANDYLSSDRYETVFMEEGVIAIFRDTWYQEQ